jgi:D-alanyl-lipoteichoic acid acyltransferase DltB (MBOAT superfamily)
MPFNAPAFLYLFLPAVLWLWWRLQLGGREAAAQWAVVAASVLFYGGWNWAFVPLLAASVLLNYRLGRELARSRSARLLALGLAFNLGLLGYFKYANFLLGNIGWLAGQDWPKLDIVLPLGISFFTFQKIAFLVDCQRGQVARFDLRRFAFFVAFFPQLVAGPVVHHAELIPQIESRARFDARLFSQGLFLLVLGLFKKAVIADRLAEQVDPLFAAATPLPLAEAWTAAVGYGLQLYYDFSGYSEMAVGMGLMFGLRLPQNFNSPYQAASIADFWRRWHMSLSRFLRDYLYIPLGGSRHGFARGIAALMATFVLGGLWHGAAWTFVAWGALHGAFVALHRVWAGTGLGMPRPLGVLLTWLAVTFAWVLFRADSMVQALSIWQGMAGLNGADVPSAFHSLCAACPPAALVTGVELCVFLMLLAWCVERPNAADAAERLLPDKRSLLRFYAAALACVFLAGGRQSFIYWQF